METRARYVLIGLFTVAVIAAAFGFVYWMENTGGLGQRAQYRVRFNGPVSGLTTGSIVMFNGIRTGEVTGLRLSRQDPRLVEAVIAVDPITPVRADTRVSIEFQGLTGVPVIFLTGGSPDAPPAQGRDGDLPLLKADPSSGVSMMQAGRQVLQRLDNILAENGEALHSTVDNINTFSAALSRNSERVDGIFAGLERMTGGAKKGTTQVYDIAALREVPEGVKVPAGLMVVPEPTALLAFDSEKIQVRPEANGKPSLDGIQWADNLPKVIQQKVVQSFENAGAGQSVSRPVEGAMPDYQLTIDIRAFHVTAEAQPQAQVEYGAKVVSGGGKIVAARVFKQSAPAKSLDAPAAAAALDQAFGKTLPELVLWATEAASQPPAPPADKG
jgi:phospholipid/cholesterol/gamma-HCH transport system substrate-binding protein